MRIKVILPQGQPRDWELRSLNKHAVKGCPAPLDSYRNLSPWATSPENSFTSRTNGKASEAAWVQLILSCTWYGRDENGSDSDVENLKRRVRGPPRWWECEETRSGSILDDMWFDWASGETEEERMFFLSPRGEMPLRSLLPNHSAFPPLAALPSTLSLDSSTFVHSILGNYKWDWSRTCGIVWQHFPVNMLKINYRLVILRPSCSKYSIPE